MSPRIEQLQLLATYNRWMNEKVYEAASRLSHEELARQRGAFFGSILGTLNHLVVADTLWLQRFAAHPRNWPQLAWVSSLPSPGSLDATVFGTLPELGRHRAELDACLLEWIPAIAEQDLDGPLHYANSRGQRQARRFHGVITHVFNHQTHHRGQVTTLLTQAGVDVGVTDLLALVGPPSD